MRPTPARLSTALLLAAALTAPVPSEAASATLGPPAICHPIEIGDARSLPWDARDAFGARADYDLAAVVGDARAILRASDDALVHMETVRRAVIYLTGIAGGRDDVDAGWRAAEVERFVLALKADVVDAQLAAADKGGNGDATPRRVALAWFDAGYTVSALHQAGRGTVGAADAAAGLEMVDKAADLLPDDGGVHLGASIARYGGGRADRACYAHLDKALRVADDPQGLLRRNVMGTMGRFLDAKSHDELVAKVRTALERG